MGPPRPWCEDRLGWGETPWVGWASRTGWRSGQAQINPSYNRGWFQVQGRSGVRAAGPRSWVST